MQQKIILQIPTPCHENWNNMDTTTQNQPGKFCGSCQKNVVDFTNMSDAQVLAYFSTNKINTCGRFENDQLNRVLPPPPPPKKSWYKWMMAALVSGFIFSNKAKAQTKAKAGEVQTCQTKSVGDTLEQFQRMVLGKVAPMSLRPKHVIEGSVKDEKGNPVLGASVTIKDTRIGAVTNKDGMFFFYNDLEINNHVLVVSYVGYQPVEQTIILPKQTQKLGVLQNQDHIKLNQILLSQQDILTMGEVVVVSNPKKINKVVDTLHNSLPAIAAPTKDKLIIAPNPAKPGSPVNLIFEKAGEYQLQLFNLQSTILQSQKITITIDGEKAPFNLPASIAKGEYFITATNQQIKTQLTGKLIVQ